LSSTLNPVHSRHLIGSSQIAKSQAFFSFSETIEAHNIDTEQFLNFTIGVPRI